MAKILPYIALAAELVIAPELGPVWGAIFDVTSSAAVELYERDHVPEQIPLHGMIP